jgi:glycosyltransferase involved in cell wall biosynthesis
VWIERAVRSVLLQTVSDLELVIASDDGTDYLTFLCGRGIENARIRHVSTGGTAAGLPATRNRALSAARGSAIVCLDADDAIDPHFLVYMVPAALEQGLVISQVRYLDHATGAPLANYARPAAEGLLPLEEIYLACLHTYAAVAFDREVIRHAWREEVPLLEDAVFLAEASSVRPLLWYQAEPLYRYYRRADSLCNAPEAAERFLHTGEIILALLAREALALTPHAARVLTAYIRRNNAVELAFAHAVARGEATDYHEFLGKNLTMLHANLLTETGV